MTTPDGDDIDPSFAEALARYEDGLTDPAKLGTSLDDADDSNDPNLSDAKKFVRMLHQWAHQRESGADSTAPLTKDRPSIDPQPMPVSIHRFVIHSKLGMGGFGIVYRAHDPLTNRAVAIKVPRMDVLVAHDSRRRFEQEARATAKLDHPNIVPVWEVGLQEVVPYIVAPFYEGPTLDRWQREHLDPADSNEVARLVADLAAAIDHAHSRGVLHRDIKPSNILLVPKTADEGSPRLSDFEPKLLDFGLAKVLEEQNGLTDTGSLLGTVRYMSPEQALGKSKEIDTRSDIYSLGVVLYYLLTRHYPIDGDTDVEVLRKVGDQTPSRIRTVRTEVPRDLETICMKCLQVAPANRYQSARELEEDIERYLRGEPILARDVPLLERMWLWAKRRPAVAAVSALTVASLTAAFLFSLWSNVQLVRANREAQSQKQIATAEQARTAQLLYVADVQRAEEALGTKDIDRARELLVSHVPSSPQAPDRRSFDWHYLWKQVEAESSNGWQAHDGDVYAMTQSPDGKSLVTGGRDGTIRFWDPSAGRETATPLRTGAEINDVRYSPDGQWLASVHDDGVRLWKEGKLIRQLGNVENKPEEMWCLAWSADGKNLAAGSIKKRAYVWNVDRGEMIWVSPLFERGVDALTFWGDGSLLVTGTDEGLIRTWDIAKSVDKPMAEGLLIEEGVCDFARDGEDLLVTGDNGEFARYDVSTGAVDHLLNTSRSQVMGICVPYPGRVIVSNKEGWVNLWDWREKKLVSTIVHRSLSPHRTVFLPEFGRLAVGWSDGRVTLHSFGAKADRLHVIKEYQPSVIHGLAFLDDEHLVVGGQTLRIVDRNVERVIDERPGVHPRSKGVVRIAPNRRWLARGMRDSGVEVYAIHGDRFGEKQEYHFDSQEQSCSAFAIDPTSRWLAVGIEFGCLLIDTQSREVKRFDTPDEVIDAAEFSSDSKRLITFSHQRQLRVLSVPDFEMVGKQEAFIRPLVSRPLWETEQMVLGGRDGKLVLFDLSSLKPKASIQLPIPTISSIAISPDGKTIGAVGDLGDVLFVDRQKWRLLPESVPIPTIARDLASITVSPDGKEWVVGDSDGNLFLFNRDEPLERREQFRSMPKTESWSMTQDGAMLALATAEGAIVRAFEASPLPGMPSGEVVRVAIDGKGTRLISIEMKRSPPSLTTTCREMATGKVLWQKEDGHSAQDYVDVLRISADGNLVAITWTNGDCEIRDGTTGKTRETVRGHARTLEQICFSDDGRWLATVGSEGVAYLWDCKTFARVRTFDHHGLELRAATFSPDGRLLATGDERGTITWWDTATGVRLKQVQTSRRRYTEGLAISADGKTIAVCDHSNVVEMFNVESGQRTLSISFEQQVNWLDFARTRGRLVVALGESPCIIRAIDIDIPVPASAVPSP